MTRPEQKKEEWEIVNRLRSVLPDLPAGDLECQEKNEKPDCIVRRPDGKYLGIEVTKLARDADTHGSRLERYQTLTENIAIAANDAYALLGGVWPYAHIYFADSFRCRREQIARFGEEIAKAVYPFIQRSTSAVMITVHRSNAALPNGLEQLHVYRYPELLRPQFCVATRGPWEWLTLEHIQKILNGKNRKVPVYRQKCDEVWLLIYIERARRHAWVQIPDDIGSFSFTTDFDRLLLLDGDVKVYELTATNRPVR